MKKLISCLLVVLMLVTSLPMATFAEELNQPEIKMDSTEANPGENFDVDITLKNNPGIVSANLKIAFDEGLTLVGATNGDVFSTLTYIPPKQLSSGGSITSGCQFAWSGFDIADKDIKDGTILSLTFELSEYAEIGDTFNISVSNNVGDVIDKDLNKISLSAQSVVTAVDYKPGDVNDDGSINMLDVVVLSRYIVDGCKYDPDGYAVNVNENAADVNADTSVNMLDVVLISRFIVDGCKTDPNGYNVTLCPSGKTCNHNLQATEAKEATCTEEGNIAYWQCTKCSKYFADENAATELDAEDVKLGITDHTLVVIPGYPATTDKEGLSDGEKCSVCGIITVEQKPIATNAYEIAYRHYVKRENANGTVEIVNDEYLSSHEIINPNPTTYIAGEGVSELIEGVEIDNQKVSAAGYSFLGWFEKPETTANRVYSISAEEKGKKILYGVWSKNVYTITYLPDSPSSILPRVEDGTYTIDKVTSLNAPPSWPNMVWIGWSDDNGKIVKSIPKGTTGEITLTANWMSKRSQTVPNTKYSTQTPAITADPESGIYTFTYEIGDIQNVPIQQVEDGVDGKGFNLVKGMTHEVNKEFYQKIGTDEATSVADTISNATTKSDAWTLSEDWNKSTSFSQEHSSEVSQEQSQKASLAFSETGKYSISSGIGGTEEHIDETGKSTKTTSKNEVGVSANVGVEAKLKGAVTAATPFKNASVKAELGLEYKHTSETEEQTNEKHTDKTSSSWNVNKGFETSSTLSGSNEMSSSISQSIKETFNYGETLDFGGSKSNTVSSSNTSSESREYSSSVVYSTETGSKINVNETLTADADTGFYRKVLAANFRVFAVVIYDMKSSTFSTMTKSYKINNSEHLFTDYSTVSSFDDYENGVLPFEVPTFVGDYVYGLVGKTDGLRINEEGIIESFGFKDPATGICYNKYDDYTDTYSDPCDTDVIIPRYVVVSVDNNEKRIVPVSGFVASAFSGTNITSVYLSDSITEIPEGAFKDCTSLKYVRGGTIDTIGKDAFKNCTSLFEFVLPAEVTALGAEAFYGVNALTVNVANKAVFDSALATGVKRLSLDLEAFEGSIDGCKIEVPEYMEAFSLNGGGKIFNNVSVVAESKLDTVAINNITINNSADIPLKLNADKIELGFTTINASNLILRSDSENVVVTLNGTNNFISAGNNAILSRNIRFIEKEGSSAAGKLLVTGNVLVYGTAYGTQRVMFNKEDEHTFKYLTQEEYEYLLSTRRVSFNANGGAVSTSSKEVGAGGTYGELPVPTRDYYSFDGWYTAADGGVKVTSDTQVSDIVEITLYAHWKENPVSEWVLASNVPSNAKIVSEKWAYTLREYTTNGSSSLSGWTKYDTVRTGWGATQGPVYTNPSNGSRNVWSEKYVASTTTHYTFYHRYGWGYNVSTGTNGYVWGSDSQLGSGARHEIDLTSDLTKTSNFAGNACWKGYKCPSCGNSTIWLGRSTYVVENKKDRWYYQEPVYTYYYYRDVNKEAVSDPSGQTDISNVVKWVQYREK